MDRQQCFNYKVSDCKQQQRRALKRYLKLSDIFYCDHSYNCVLIRIITLFGGNKDSEETICRHQVV